MYALKPTPKRLERHRKQQELRNACTKILNGHGLKKPSEEATEIARYCELHNIDADSYGTGNFLQSFEEEIAKLLGYEAAVFLPTGVMSQMIAMRIHCEAKRLDHIAFHPTCHLEQNEEHAYAFLHGLRSTLLGSKSSVLLADDISNCTEELASVIIELPLRRLGGILPSWEELTKIKNVAKEKNIQLHLDGARLWESQPFYGKSFSEICAGFATAYVSFYKGIGSVAGSMLLGSAAFISEARVWQRRHGGNLVQIYPLAVSSKLNFDKRIGKFSAYRECALSLSEELQSFETLSFRPALPHPDTNMLHVFLPYSPEVAEAARDTLAQEEKFWLTGGFFPTEIPGGSFFELVAGDSSLKLSKGELSKNFSKFLELCKKS